LRMFILSGPQSRRGPVTLVYQTVTAERNGSTG
jgi:hypothetical protein